jgi:hypothetical protein
MKEYRVAMLHNTTPTPNELFASLPSLSDAELRVLLIVIRQTFGWMIPHTNQRKIKDKLTYSFLIKKTGLYRTILSRTIQSLIDKNLLIVTDTNGTLLDTATKRTGKHCLYYQFNRPVRVLDSTHSENETAPVRNSEYNKRNTYQKKLLQNKKKIELMQRQLLDAHDARYKNVHDGWKEQ